MEQSEFDNIKRGAILRHKMFKDSYVIETTNKNDRITTTTHIGVRTILITNPDEWDLVKP